MKRSMSQNEELHYNINGQLKKNEDFSVIKFFVNLKDDIHIHLI